MIDSCLRCDGSGVVPMFLKGSEGERRMLEQSLTIPTTTCPSCGPFGTELL